MNTDVYYLPSEGFKDLVKTAKTTISNHRRIQKSMPGLHARAQEIKAIGPVNATWIDWVDWVDWVNWVAATPIPRMSL